MPEPNVVIDDGAMRSGLTKVRGMALLLSTLAACSGNRGDRRATSPGPATIRDSAGITIVENRGLDARVERWTLDSAPMVVIGEENRGADYLLGRVGRVMFLPGGEILVTEANPSRAEGQTRDNIFRIFDSAGRFLRRFGGTGEGPGEFNSIDDLFLVGDSLWVYEPVARRASVVDLNGRFGRMVTNLEGWSSIVGRIDSGWLVIRGHRDDRGPMRGWWEDSASVWRVRDNGVADSLLTMKSDRYENFASGTFVRSPLTGGAVVALDDSLVYAGTGATYQINVLSLDGKLRRIIRRDIPPRAVTTQVIADLKARFKKQSSGSYDGFLDRLTFPPTAPSYMAFEADDAGNLWVQQYYDRIFESRPDTMTWTVFDSKGVLRAEAALRIRAALTIGAIRSDRIAFIDNDNARVLIYRLTKTAVH